MTDKIKPPNPIAKDLANPKYRQRTKPNMKKIKKEKEMVKKMLDDGNLYV